MARLLLFAAAMPMVAAVSPIAAERPSSAGSEVARGQHEFQSFGCAACHGTTGAGGGWQGPKLAPDPLPFEAFLGQLREPANKMPRYSAAVLTDKQAAEMHAYLSSIPPGKRAVDIRMLNR